ncbi:hypothetical protein SAMN05421870_12512 [Streptomyces qinglanensis]|uniref:Uncharacterized protein n=1 Tax=Streptomyces qinglanensis TaxID=943816 RepID=A0A1H9WXS4_9ACTN|nr:hypothetical protein SAMN05421870_12512 [Streptomyces qinglanensis]
MKEQDAKDTDGRQTDDLPRLTRPPRPGGGGSGPDES